MTLTVTCLLRIQRSPILKTSPFEVFAPDGDFPALLPELVGRGVDRIRADREPRGVRLRPDRISQARRVGERLSALRLRPDGGLPLLALRVFLLFVPLESGRPDRLRHRRRDMLLVKVGVVLQAFHELSDVSLEADAVAHYIPLSLSREKRRGLELTLNPVRAASVVSDTPMSTFPSASSVRNLIAAL